MNNTAITTNNTNIGKAQLNKMLREFFNLKQKMKVAKQKYDEKRAELSGLLFTEPNDVKEVIKSREYSLIKSPRCKHDYQIAKLSLICQNMGEDISEYLTTSVDVDKVEVAIKEGKLPMDTLKNIDNGKYSVNVNVEKITKQ